MNFLELENAGKKALEQYPFLKRSIKRMYQVISVATSLKKSNSEGNIVKISPDDGFEYFYGYYDKSPWDSTDRYVIAMKAKQTYKFVAPKEPAIVGVFDTKDNNSFIEIGSTHSWNVQQGCMAQWMGPDFKTRILYNDFRDGKYCAVIYNFVERKEEKVLSMAAYDVSKDGSFFLSLDFNRLHRMRPGYGYSNLEDKTKGILCPNTSCIWKVDITSGKVEELFKYTDFAEFEPDESMNGAEHKVNHLMISPNGKRFMVLHRWFCNGRKHTRLVTVNVDKTEMYNLSDDVFVSHCFWKNDEEILSFLRKKETGYHYYLMTDKTKEYQMLWPCLKTDGHCSYYPKDNIVVTDTYPNRKRMAYVYLCREEQVQPVRIAKVYSPFKYDNDCRCDLHPRWNHNGDTISIDSVHNGKRGLYFINVDNKDIPPLPLKKPKLINGKYKIVYAITNCKNSGPMNQTLNIIKNLDRKIFQPIVVTLFQEDLGNSVIQRYKNVVPEMYCLNMNKLESIFTGRKKMNKLLSEIKPDLIHGLGMPPYTMTLKYKKAVHFVTLRNYCYQDYPDKYGKFLGKLLAFKDMKLIKRQIKRGEVFITCSKSLSKIYEKEHNMRFDYIRNGVDISKYNFAEQQEKQEAKKRLGVPEGKLVIATTGQFIPRKNQRFLIDGMMKTNLADSFYMILMGDGPELEELKSIYGHDSRLLFTGSVNNVEEYLKASDLYVSASKSEGMPNGVLEAMASGLPVVLSDISQHLEVLEVNDLYGRKYKLGDFNSFIQVINKISTEDLNKMSAEARRVSVENFSAYNMSIKYQELYMKLIEKSCYEKDSFC